VLLDTLLGMGLVVAMLMLLAVDVTQQRRATMRLAQRRAAVNLAERALTDLQAGRPAPAAEDGMTLSVVDLPIPRGPGYASGRWVEVRVTGPAGTQSLIGLIAVPWQRPRP
jgi:hypothetical protein